MVYLVMAIAAVCAAFWAHVITTEAISHTTGIVIAGLIAIFFYLGGIMSVKPSCSCSA